MHTRVFLGVLIAALAVAAGVVVAHAVAPDTRTYAPEMNAGMGFLPRIARELQLTPQQTQALMGLHREYAEETSPVRQRLRTEMKEMALLWTDRRVGADQLRAQADVVDALKTQLRNTTIDYALRARAVLTEEQLARISGWITAGTGPAFGKGCPLGGEHGGVRGRNTQGPLST